MNAMIAILGLGAASLLFLKSKADESDSDAKSRELTAMKKKAAEAEAALKAAEEKKAAEDRAIAEAAAKAKAGDLSSAGKEMTAEKSPAKKLSLKPADYSGFDKVMCTDLVSVSTPFKYQKVWEAKNGSPVGPFVSAYLLTNAKASAADFDLVSKMLAAEVSLRPVFGESADVTKAMSSLYSCLLDEKSRRFK